MALDHQASEFLTKLMFLDLEKEAAGGLGRPYIRRLAGKGSRAALESLSAAAAKAKANAKTAKQVVAGNTAAISTSAIDTPTAAASVGTSVPKATRPVPARRPPRGRLESTGSNHPARRPVPKAITKAATPPPAAREAVPPTTPPPAPGAEPTAAAPKPKLALKDRGRSTPDPTRGDEAVRSITRNLPTATTAAEVAGASAALPVAETAASAAAIPAAADGKKGASILAHLLALIGGGGIGAAAGGYAGYGAGYDMTHDTFRH